MAAEASVHQSRRAVLAGAFGGFAGLVFAWLGRPQRAAAATGGNAILGQSNSADDPTGLTNTASGELALGVTSSGDGIGIRGVSPAGGAGVVGVAGDPASFGNANAALVGFATTAHAHGVMGQANGDGYGLYGFSNEGDGIRAESFGAGRAGIFASHGEISAAASPPYNSGVYGFGNVDETAVGVWGDSYKGTGVVGSGSIGVYGTGSAGVMGDVDASATGVYAFSGDASAPQPPGGRALYARAATTAQIALEAVGRVRFSRSGRSYVASGASSRRIYMAGVSTSSYVIATLQTNRAGYHVQSVVCGTGYFTIYLNKAVPGTTYLGYLVIN